MKNLNVLANPIYAQHDETLPSASNCVLPKDGPSTHAAPLPSLPTSSKEWPRPSTPQPTSPAPNLPRSGLFQPQGHRGDQLPRPLCPGTTRPWISPNPIPTALSQAHPISENRPLLASQAFKGLFLKALPPFPLLFSPSFSPCIPPQTPAQ